MRMRRLLLVALAGLLLLGLFPAAASASPAPCSNPRRIDGENGRVRVEVVGCPGTTWVGSVRVRNLVSRGSYVGHHDILIPVEPGRINGPNGSGPPDATWNNVNRYMPHNSQICGEGWRANNGRWDLMGRPCVRLFNQ
jgi:hypothetical protein